MMKRREFLLGAASATGALLAGCTPVDNSKVLRAVLHADLQSLDPIVTSIGIVQRHALMVYDFLFGRDAYGTPKPQMVDRWSVSEDRLDWEFTLRDGLFFHDGVAVTTTDVIASLRRWGQRDVYGRQIFAITNELSVIDDQRFVWRLEKPYSLLLHALSKTGGPVAAIMPAGVAATSATKSIKSSVGSGPYVFDTDAWIPGAKVVYRRNQNYQPRKEAPDGTAGGKRVYVETVEWLNIRDPQSAVLALANGEIDFVENPSSEFLPLLRDAGVTIQRTDTLGFQGMLRMNHLHPPFDDPRARQALLYLIDQDRYLQAMFGDPEVTNNCSAYFVCGSPLESKAGIPQGIGKNRKKARELMEASGYDGRPLVILHPTDIQFMNLATLVLADDLKSIGVNVDLQAMDFGAMGSRRANRASPTSGGWDLGLTYWPGGNITDPVGNVPMQANCEEAWPGWPCDAEHQSMIEAFPYARDDSERKALADQIQSSAYELVPYVPIGQWFTPVAYSPRVSDVVAVPGSTVFWNMKKKPFLPKA